MKREHIKEADANGGGSLSPQALVLEAPTQRLPAHLRQGHMVLLPLRPLHHRRPQRLALPRLRRRRPRPSCQWDQPVPEYVSLAERYLGFQHSDFVYGFTDAGDGHKRLSWSFEKRWTKLEWRWKCQPSPNSKETTAIVLDFLMDANFGLSEEVVRKTESFERLKVEAEKCLTQSEKIANEKMDFEFTIYVKFLGVLNSKKAKLRELRDKLSKQEAAGKRPQEEEESTDKTETFVSDDENSEVESLKYPTAICKDIPSSRSRVRKRTLEK